MVERKDKRKDKFRTDLNEKCNKLQSYFVWNVNWKSFVVVTRRFLRSSHCSCHLYFFQDFWWFFPSVFIFKYFMTHFLFHKQIVPLSSFKINSWNRYLLSRTLHNQYKSMRKIFMSTFEFISSLCKLNIQYILLKSFKYRFLRIISIQILYVSMKQVKNLTI